MAMVQSMLYAIGNPRQDDLDAADACEDVAARASFLRKQADWCVDMATKALSPMMFSKYVELAASYQQLALELERRPDIGLD